MVRRLKKRPRPDTHDNQARKAGGNIGKQVYLALLAAFCLAITNYLWGDLIFLRGDGLILRDQTVVAATYVSRIESVDVKEGQNVKQGDLLLQVKSAEVLERLADLSVRRAELISQSGDTILRYEAAVQLLPLATKRAKETAEFVQRIEGPQNRGAITSSAYQGALRANYDARQDRIRLSAETNMLQQQLAAFEEARLDAAKAVNDLQDLYAGGEFRSVINGVVGATIPKVGTVYNAGEPILSVYSGEAYVLAYLPRRYLFSIKPGSTVAINSGRQRAKGVIMEILPVTDALPQEFQNTFKPRDRNQLAKIKIIGDETFPLFEKVSITREYF